MDMIAPLSLAHADVREPAQEPGPKGAPSTLGPFCSSADIVGIQLPVRQGIHDESQQESDGHKQDDKQGFRRSAVSPRS